MDKQELTPEQEQFKQEQLERGAAFEEIARSKGFEYLKAYHAQELKAFVNALFQDPNRSIGDFEAQRQQLFGLKKMFSEIEWSIKSLEDERTKEQSS